MFISHKGTIRSVLYHNSSKCVVMPPEVTSRPHDVNKHGGGVIDLIMKITYLICELPTEYANDLLHVQIT